MATAGQGVLRRLLAVFVFDADTKGLERGKKKTEDLLNDMKKVAAAFAGGVIAKGIGEFVKNTVDEMMQIRKGAAELRITTDEMQALRSAGRALGMDVKWLHFSMERLQVSTELAERGSKRQAESMKLLGLETRKANGEQKSAAELFLDMADGIQKIKDPSKQAIAVWDMFGRGGHRLLPLLRLGRERIQELMDATKEYGRYEKETIEQAAKYTITLEHLRLRFVGLKNFIMSQWLPILDKQTQGVIKAIGWFMKLAKNSLAAEAALRLLQVGMGVLALKMAFAYPKATALIAGLTALWLIVDDLMVLFRGGHSLIGDAIDGLFGKGASTAFIEKVRDIWRDIEQFASLTWEHTKKVLNIKDSADTRAHVGVSSPAVLDLQDRQDRKRADDELDRWEKRAGKGGKLKTVTEGSLSFLPRAFQQDSGAGILQQGVKDIAESLGLYTSPETKAHQAARESMNAGDWQVQVNFHGPIFHPESEIRRIAEQTWKESTKAAAAALRREKHASGE